MELETPRGYTLKTPKNQEWSLVSDQDGFTFDVSNRHFELIDEQLNNRISTTIENLLSTRCTVRVLDLGGGSGSHSALGISYKYGDSVKVTNVDLLTVPWEYPKNVSPIRSEATRLPFRDESFDFVYSYSLLPYFRFQKPLGIVSEIDIIREIKRVIKPNSQAVLDEVYLSYLSDKEFLAAEKQLGVRLEKEKRGALDFSSRLTYFWFEPLKTPKFLVMTKT